jgi:RimJ/RimL family protein N-acetyltransferase
MQVGPAKFNREAIAKNTKIKIARKGEKLTITIDTPRLVLKSAARKDSYFYQNELFSDPQVMQYWNNGRALYFKDKASERKGTINFGKAQVTASVARWNEGNPWAYYTVRDKATQKPIGAIGIWDEALYYLYAERSWGQGFATEAAFALVNVAVPQIINARVYKQNPDNIVASCHPDNMASQKILSALGLKVNTKKPQKSLNKPLKYTIPTVELVEQYNSQNKVPRPLSPLFDLQRAQLPALNSVKLGEHALRNTALRQKRGLIA